MKKRFLKYRSFLAASIIFILLFILPLLLFAIRNPKKLNIGMGAISGDCNIDGKVDIIDFQLLSNSFGKSVGQTGYYPGCDFNSDNTISILDFQMLSNNFGNSATTPSPTPAQVSCLSLPGPLITLSGSRTTYSNTSLANNSKIDATTATFTNGGQVPVTFGGGSNVCWHSGKIYGGYPLNASWDTTHPTAGIEVNDRTPRPLVEGAYVDQIGDGIKVRLGESTSQTGIAEPFTVRGTWLRDIRDDCVESDWQAGALLDDNLFDGCYTLFATEKRSGAGTNGSNNTWEIKNMLAYMHDQIGVYSGTSPGHSMFFKWDSTSPKIKIYNSIFRVDSDVSETSYTRQFDIPKDKLIDCSNNTLVWLGAGNFPGTLPACFSITKDISVWNNAVAAWKIRHGISQ